MSRLAAVLAMKPWGSTLFDDEVCLLLHKLDQGVIKILVVLVHVKGVYAPLCDCGNNWPKVEQCVAIRWIVRMTAGCMHLEVLVAVKVCA